MYKCTRSCARKVVYRKILKLYGNLKVFQVFAQVDLITANIFECIVLKFVYEVGRAHHIRRRNLKHGATFSHHIYLL